MEERVQTQRKQQELWNDWQRNGLRHRLQPSRPRVWCLRCLGRLVVHLPQTLLRMCHSILGFSRRLQGYSRGDTMDQAAIDAIVYWAGACFLGGFTVGVIVKLLLGRME